MRPDTSWTVTSNWNLEPDLPRWDAPARAFFMTDATDRRGKRGGGRTWQGGRGTTVKGSNAQRSPLGGTSNSGQLQTLQRSSRRHSNPVPPPPAPRRRHQTGARCGQQLPPTPRASTRSRRWSAAGGQPGGVAAVGQTPPGGSTATSRPPMSRTSHSRRGVRGPHGAVVVGVDGAAAAAPRAAFSALSVGRGPPQSSVAGECQLLFCLFHYTPITGGRALASGCVQHHTRKMILVQ